MIYVLMICASMTGPGCASVTRYEYPTAEACQAALTSLVAGMTHAFAVCAPREGK